MSLSERSNHPWWKHLQECHWGQMLAWRWAIVPACMCLSPRLGVQGLWFNQVSARRPRAKSWSSSAALPEAPRQPATQPSITPYSRALTASRRSNNHRPQPLSFAGASRWTSTQPMPRLHSWWPLADSAAIRTPHGCFGDGSRRFSDHPWMDEHFNPPAAGPPSAAGRCADAPHR